MTIGDIPDDVIDAYLWLRHLIDLAQKGKQVVIENPIKLPPDWEFSDYLYVCLQYSEDVDIETRPGRADQAYAWYRSDSMTEVEDAFLSRARAPLDITTSMLIPQLPDGYIGHTIVSEKVYLTAENTPTQEIGGYTAGIPYVATRHDDWPRVDSLLDGLGNFAPTCERDLESVGRWYSLAIGERDAFKRFIWAYAGLEVTAKKSLPRIRSEIVDNLRYQGPNNALVSGPAIRELLWPTALVDERDPLVDPERNLTFRFAAMALQFFPGQANEDIRDFKEIQNFRNRIHGQQMPTKSVARHAHTAVQLLRRYAPTYIARLRT